MIKQVAREAFGDSFKRSIRGVSMIAGARRAAELYRSSGGVELLREGLHALQFLRQSGLPEQVVQGLISSSGGEHGYIQGVIDHQTGSFTAVIDSASLIAAHALLDDALLQYCRVSATFDPSAWESLVARKKIELSELKQISYDELRDRLLTNHLGNLERESLPAIDKYDALMRVLRPSGEESQHLDRDRLVSLDEERHDIVHRAGLRALPKFDDDFRFLQGVIFVGWYLTWKRYPDSYDPTLVGGTTTPT